MANQRFCWNLLRGFLGIWSNLTKIFFQMGWFNHHLVKDKGRKIGRRVSLHTMYWEFCFMFFFVISSKVCEDRRIVLKNTLKYIILAQGCCVTQGKLGDLSSQCIEVHRQRITHSTCLTPSSSLPWCWLMGILIVYNGLLWSLYNWVVMIPI